MKVLGLSGLAGAGKDYVADILCNEHGFVKVCFADPLKRICMDLFGWSEERLWGESKYRNEPDQKWRRPNSEDGYLTARYALQKLGTEFARDCSDDVWVSYLLRTCTVLERGYHGYDRTRGLIPLDSPYAIEPKRDAVRAVVVPDIRFVNEIDGLRNRGATMVRLIRIGDEPKWDHRSETEQLSVADDAFDEVIRCASGDLEQLQRSAHLLAAKLLG
jgi:hypothetical protein